MQRLPYVITKSIVSDFCHTARIRVIQRQHRMAAGIGGSSDAAALKGEFTCLNSCCSRQLVDGVDADPPSAENDIYLAESLTALPPDELQAERLH